MDLETRADVRDGVLVISLQGELTSGQSTSFKTWAAEQAQGGPGDVEVNCEKLHFIDSTGLGCLIHLRKCVIERDGNLVMTHVSGWLRKFLQVTGLEEIFCGPQNTSQQEPEQQA